MYFFNLIVKINYKFTNTSEENQINNTEID